MVNARQTRTANAPSRTAVSTSATTTASRRNLFTRLVSLKERSIQHCRRLRCCCPRQARQPLHLFPTAVSAQDDKNTRQQGEHTKRTNILAIYRHATPRPPPHSSPPTEYLSVLNTDGIGTPLRVLRPLRVTSLFTSVQLSPPCSCCTPARRPRCSCRCRVRRP